MKLTLIESDGTRLDEDLGALRDAGVHELVATLRPRVQSLWVRDGETDCVVHHRHAASFGTAEAPVTSDALQVILIELRDLQFTLDELGLTVWRTPLIGGLAPFHEILARKQEAGLVTPTPPERPGAPLPTGAYRAGLALAEVVEEAGGPSVKLIGERRLSTFLGHLEPEELCQAAYFLHHRGAYALPATPSRPGFTLDVANPEAVTLWQAGEGPPRPVPGESLVQGLELLARAMCMPHAAADESAWWVPDWVAPLKQAALGLRGALDRAGTPVFAPSTEVHFV